MTLLDDLQSKISYSLTQTNQQISRIQYLQTLPAFTHYRHAESEASCPPPDAP